ncbi:hypothetical protein [Parasphingopyxis marina]|uniref:Uncharacterized protein n=1 Tax=Parasphingopyxis marina TaxID=2761622 RepID=A0A842I3N5_9SPHN|nr:hypothetical protein [Parasphingopyxis marina]MBC2778654.1 hypothetical protein [Parasphingopyxis marina]
MRRLSIAAPLLIALAASAPAAAQDDWPGESYADDSAGELPPPTSPDIWDDDPYAQSDETVLMVDRFVSTLLDMPVASIAAALPQADIAGDVRPGDTLRDVMERENPELETQMRGGARALTAMIGDMSRQLTTMMPELESWSRRMRRDTDN